MKFEEALDLMRKGKYIKRPVQWVPKTIIKGQIVEVYKNEKGKITYEPLQSINCSNIVAGDWEEVKK